MSQLKKTFKHYDLSYTLYAKTYSQGIPIVTIYSDNPNQLTINYDPKTTADKPTIKLEKYKNLTADKIDELITKLQETKPILEEIYKFINETYRLNTDESYNINTARVNAIINLIQEHECFNLDAPTAEEINKALESVYQPRLVSKITHELNALYNASVDDPQTLEKIKNISTEIYELLPQYRIYADKFMDMIRMEEKDETEFEKIKNTYQKTKTSIVELVFILSSIAKEKELGTWLAELDETQKDNYYVQDEIIRAFT